MPHCSARGIHRLKRSGTPDGSSWIVGRFSGSRPNRMVLQLRANVLTPEGRASKNRATDNSDQKPVQHPAAVPLERFLSQADSQCYFFRGIHLSRQHMVDDFAHFFRVLWE